METTDRIDHRAGLTGNLHMGLDFYLKDLAALTDEQLAASPGGCARTPLQITAEVGDFNSVCAKILKGEDVPKRGEEAYAEMISSIDTRDKAVAHITGGTQELVGALGSLDESDLATVVTTPFGMEMSKFDLAGVCAWHTTYHDGQLNYIQCLNGDGEMHWQ